MVNRQAPIYANGLDVVKVDNAISVNRESLSAQRRTNEEHFWSTPRRSGDERIRDVFQVNLNSARPINVVTFELARFPHLAYLFYLDDKGSWKPAFDEHGGQVVVSIRDSIPSVISPFPGQQGHPQHYGAGHWVNHEVRVKPIKTASLRLVLVRQNTRAVPVDQSLNPTPYSLGVRNFSVGYKIVQHSDVPRARPTPQQNLPLSERTPFASTSDILGSPVAISAREHDPADLLRYTSPGESVVWKCDPQPISDAVVNLYVDARDGYGQASVIDRFFLDPTTSGPQLNLYYSTENPHPEQFFSPDSPVYFPNLRQVGDQVVGDAEGLLFPNTVSYLDIDNTAIQWDLQRPFWLGMQLQPQFSSADTHTYTLLDTGFLTLTWDGTAILLRYGSQTLSWPMHFSFNQKISFVVAYDGTGILLYTSQGSQSSITPLGPIVIPALQASGQTDRIRIGGSVLPSSNQTANMRLNGLVIKAQVPPGQGDYDAFIRNPSDYTIKPEFAIEDLGLTDNAILRYAPEYQSGRTPYGILGGPPSVSYADLVWQPISRDYKLHTGFLVFNPTKATFFKFEFTDLSPHLYDQLEPVVRYVQVYPDELVKTAPLPLNKSNNTASGGALVAQSSSATSHYADESRLYLRKAVNPVGSYTPTQAIFSTEQSIQRQLRSSSIYFSLQKWHQSPTAPRFTSAMRHIYKNVEVKHDQRIAYSVGLHALKMYRVNYLAEDDAEQYLESFQDTAHISDDHTPTLKNYAVNSQFSASTATIEARRNNSANPQPVATTGWAGLSATQLVTAPWDSTGTAYQAAGNGSATAYIFTPGTNVYSIGDTITVSAMIRVPNGMYYRTAVHDQTGDVYYAYSPYTLSDGSPVRVSATATLTATPTNVGLAVLWYSDGSGGVATNGSLAQVGDVLNEIGSVLLPQFDGSSAASDGLTYSWLGTSGLSVSIATGFVPFGWQGLNAKAWLGADRKSCRVLVGKGSGVFYPAVPYPSVPGDTWSHSVDVGVDSPASTRTGQLYTQTYGDRTEQDYSAPAVVLPSTLNAVSKQVPERQRAAPPSAQAAGLTGYGSLSTAVPGLPATSSTAEDFFLSLPTPGMYTVRNAVSQKTVSGGALNLTPTAPWQVNSKGGYLSTPDGMGLDDVVRTQSVVYSSRRKVTGVQFATQQTPPVQVLPNADFDEPTLADWQPYGTAVLTASNEFNTDIGTMVRLDRSDINFWGSIEQTYPTWDAIESSGAGPNDPKWRDLESIPNASSSGGIETARTYHVSPLGRVYAAARVYSPVALTAPLHIQLLNRIGQVISQQAIDVHAGEVAEWFTTYTVGDAGQVQRQTWGQVTAGSPSWTQMEGRGSWGQVDQETSHYADEVSARLVQLEPTNDVWYVDNISVFDDPIVWEFSNDFGANWYPAYGIRNNADGVFVFPKLGDSRSGLGLMWRVTAARPDQQINYLSIRPWYDYHPLGTPYRETIQAGGPNTALIDHYPPITEDPRWKVWDKPIPEEWFFVFRRWVLHQRESLDQKYKSIVIPSSITPANLSPAEAIIVNAVVNPTFENDVHGVVARYCTISHSTSWSSVRDGSLQMLPSTASSDSYVSVGADVGGLRLGMVPSKQYTFSADINTPVALTGPVSDLAQRIVVYINDGTGYSAFTSDAGPATGTNRLSVTFTVPVGATEAFVRLYNGSTNVAANAVQWDALRLAPGTETDYVDGNTKADLRGYYSWAGQGDDSVTLRSPGNQPGVIGTVVGLSGSGSLNYSGVYALHFGFTGFGQFMKEYQGLPLSVPFVLVPVPDATGHYSPTNSGGGTIPFHIPHHL